MIVPAALRSSLPAELSPEAVRAAVRSPGSRGSFSGETWLVELDGGLAVLGRGSVFDALEWIELADDGQPAVVVVPDGFTTKLQVRCADGHSFELRPGTREAEAALALLDRASGVAPRPRMSTEEAEGVPSPVPPPSASAEPVAPPQSRLEPGPSWPAQSSSSPSAEPDAGLDALCRALRERDFETAAPLARALATDPPGSRQHWAALVETIDRLRSGEAARAYLWTRGAVSIPGEVDEDLFTGLARELEACDEPVLAWDACSELIDDEVSGSLRARIESELGRDGPSLAREVAERARDMFEALLESEPDEPVLMRALAKAYLDLDELDEALRRVRAALARDASDYETRVLETRILALQAIELDDDQAYVEALEAVAADFPDAAEPLVDLADHHEFDAPHLAIRYLQQALEREHDELTLIALAELYEANQRWSNLVELLGQALARPDADAYYFDVESHRERLARAERALSLRPGQAVARHEGAPVAPTSSRSFVIAVFVLVLVALAAAVAGL